MIDLLTRTVAHPAEWTALVVAGIGSAVVLLRAARRRGGPGSTRWIEWMVPLALLAGALASARGREVATLVAVSGVKATALSGFVVHRHGQTADGIWLFLLLCAAVVLLAAVLRVGWTRSAPDPLLSAVALGLLGVGAVWVPGALLAGGLLAGVAAVASRDRRTGADGLLGVAAVVSAVSAVAAAEAELAHALALIDLPLMLPRMRPLAAAWWGVAGGALMAAGRGLWLAVRGRDVIAVAAITVTAVLLVVWGATWAHTKSWGPAPQLAGLSVAVGANAPVHHPEQAWRWSGGCLWSRSDGGWSSREWGRISLRHRLSPCPVDQATPRLADRPVIVVDGATPAADLLALGAPGELTLLVRLAADPGPRWMEPWRWATDTLPVLTAAAEGPWRALPDAVVVRGAALPDALSDAVRLDVVLVPEPAATVADVLARCVVLRQLHPIGLRCALGAGDW